MEELKMVQTIYNKIADKTFYRRVDNWGDTCMDDFDIAVMIWDCLSYFNEKTIWVDYITKDILNFWTKKRKPIEDQPSDCIIYIYTLINIYE